MKWEEHMLRWVTKVSATIRLYNDFTWSNKVTVVLPKTPQFQSYKHLWGAEKGKASNQCSTMIEPNKASEGRALPVGYACSPRHHQALRNGPNITDNSSQEHTKLQMKANTVEARINGIKHHMQKQLVTKCEQRVYESSSLLTPIFHQHASPTPWKPPNGPTWHPINHPMERATKYCGSVGGDFFFFFLGYPEDFS